MKSTILTRALQAALLLGVLTTAGLLAHAQMKGPGRLQEAADRIVLHVNQNDAATMNLALNNAQNVAQHYRALGQRVQIEVVAYGPGLHMLRADTSPVKPRLQSLPLEMPEVTLSACGNTQANMKKSEGKDIPLLSDVKVVPSGVVRLIELQKAGYAYVKP